MLLVNQLTGFGVGGGIGGNDSFTKLLLHMDGADASTTFTDSNVGGSAHTWTANGNAQVDTAQSKFGGASGLFDGTGDWISTPDHADFTLGSGDWTVDYWFRRNSTGALNLICGQYDSSATAAGSSWAFQLQTSNILRLYVSDGSTFTTVDTTSTFGTGAWVHIAGVRTGNVLKMFVNGTQEGGDIAFTGTVPDSSVTLSVGSSGEFDSQYLNGWVDEFRLSVGVARWTADFTPPAGPYS